MEEEEDKDEEEDDEEEDGNAVIAVPLLPCLELAKAAICPDVLGNEPVFSDDEDED
jgi:hypothetical protein